MTDDLFTLKRDTPPRGGNDSTTLDELLLRVGAETAKEMGAAGAAHAVREKQAEREREQQRNTALLEEMALSLRADTRARTVKWGLLSGGGMGLGFLFGGPVGAVVMGAATLVASKMPNANDDTLQKSARELLRKVGGGG